MMWFLVPHYENWGLLQPLCLSVHHGDRGGWAAWQPLWLIWVRGPIHSVDPETPGVEGLYLFPRFRNAKVGCIV